MADIGYYALPIIPSIQGIDSQINKVLGGKLGAVGNKAGKDFAKSFGDSVEADMKRLFDTQSKLADRAADATGKLKVAQAAYNDLVEKGVKSGARYERAVAAVEKARRDETRAVRQAADALKEYEQAANKAQDSGSKAGRGFLAGLGGAVNGAAGKGSEAASSFVEGFAGSAALLRLGAAGGPIGLALATAGLVGGGLLVRNIISGIEREPARDQVAAQLGIDPASMQRLSSAAGKAYADNWGDSVQANLSTAKTAIQTGLLTGADDPGAQRIIEQLTAVSQLMGEEIPATARAAGQLIKTGLADNASQAFDLITKGEQAGLNISEDWLDTLNEYGTQFRKLGLSGPEAVGLISQALKGGARDSDVAADAIKEFSIRAVDGSDTTKRAFTELGFDAEAMSEKFAEGGPAAHDAMGQVLDAVRSIQDPLMRGQVAAALFGTQWEDLGGAFDQLNLSNAVTQLGQVDGAAQNAADTMGNNVAGSFESAKRGIEVALQGVQDKLAEVFGPSLQNVALWVQNHTDDIANFFKGMAGIAIDVGADILEAFGEITEAAGQLIGGFGNIQGAVLKFEAWQADFRGDSDLADELRRQSEEAFGWGDSLEAAGTKMRDASETMRGWKDKLNDTTTSTDEAKTSVGKLNTELGGLPSQKDIKVNLTDAQGNPLPLIGGALSGANLPGVAPGAPLIGGAGSGSRSVTPGSPLIGGGASTGFDWEGIAKAESSGNWSDNNSGGHSTSSGAPRGGLQITDGTWAAFGGTEFAPNAAMATKDQQIEVANRIAFTGYKGTPPQGLGAWETVTNGSVPGVTVNSTPTSPVLSSSAISPSQSLIGSPIYTGGKTENTGGGVVPGIAALEQAVKSQFPSATISNDYRQPDGFNEHSSGTAVDIAVNPGGVLGVKTPEGQALGSSINAWLLQNAASLGLQYTIWQGKNWHPDGSTSSNSGSGITGGHWDHVHARVSADAAAQLSGLSPGVAPTTTAFTPPSMSSPFAGGSASSAVTSGSGSLVNAFGPGYKPGLGTPGVNEMGEPGYYQTDDRQIAQADRRARDANDAIAEADQAIVDAKQHRADIEKQMGVTAEDRAKADKAIADAEQRAGDARQDAAWAQQDAAEARKGKFTQAQKAPGQKGGASGLGPLGEIAGSFLKETFGLDGSFLPDLASLGVVQTGGALLNAFSGPLRGLMDGQLGIQQPGWSPGMPVNGVPAPDLFGTTQLPALPDGTHPGTGGLPGPVSIDNSTTINSPTGDPNDIENRIRRANMNRPRIDSYAIPGT